MYMKGDSMQLKKIFFDLNYGGGGSPKPPTPPPPPKFKVGDKVTTNAEYTYNKEKHLASFVRKNVYSIIQIGGSGLPKDRIVIGKGSMVIAAVKASTLTKVSGSTTTPINAKDIKDTSKDKKKKDKETEKNSATGDFGLNKKLKNKKRKKSEGDVLFTDTRKKSSKLGRDLEREAYLKKLEIERALAKEMAILRRQDPSIIQNDYEYPKIKELPNEENGYIYKYDYRINLDDGSSDSTELHKLITRVRKSVGIHTYSRHDHLLRETSRYNKYKWKNGDAQLTKSFAHVFFTRPDCNILVPTGKGIGKLAGALNHLSEYYYALKHSPELLRQLTQDSAMYNHELMMFLSNKANSFELSDEYINDQTYGTSLTGFKVAYGTDSSESKTAGDFSIQYIDDRDLNVYHLHKLWTDYIAHVFRGRHSPKTDYIYYKILDYVTSVYYFLLAEDGETVIFWSKYWGVFPIEAPSSAFSFAMDNPGGVRMPELRIKYRYSWKEDFNPLTLIEFNEHTRNLPLEYRNSYNPNLAGTGGSWSGLPFLETIGEANGDGVPYTIKLRFRPYTKI